MEIIKLQARERTGKGKSYTRKARAAGWIPAIYYGRKKEPTPIEVKAYDFAAIVRHKQLTHLINLGLSGKEEDSIAVIKEVQKNVIKDDVYYHIDFQHVAMDEKVTVHCPIRIEGIPIGVKEQSGVLGNPVKSILIECLPMDIPEKITIDVSGLHIGESIRIKDIIIPGNITIKESPEEVVAVVTHPTREVVEKPAAEEAPGGEKTEETAAQTTDSAKEPTSE